MPHAKVLRCQQPALRVHGRLLSRSGGDREVRGGSREAGLLRRRRPAAVGCDPGDADERSGGRVHGGGRRLRPEPRDQDRHQERARRKFYADDQRARAHPVRRADHGHRDQRSGDHRHDPRRQAGRARGRSDRGRDGCGRNPDDDGRADVRRLGRLLPRALRQLSDPDGAGTARREGCARHRAGPPRDGDQGQRLQILQRISPARPARRSTTRCRRRSSSSIWPTSASCPT